MKLPAAIIAFILAIAPCYLIAALPEVPADEAGARLWKEKREATILDLQQKPIEQKVPGLAEMLRQLKTLGYRDCEERDEVIDQIRRSIFAIPGHAQYYQDKIEGIREQVKANVSLSPEEMEGLRRKGKPAVHLGDYERVRYDAFTVLALLPSPETVAVLGHFLEDPEGRDGKDLLGNPLVYHDDSPPAFPNCGLACEAITNLRIEHAPISDVKKVNTVAMDLEQVDAWKDWWNEVKSGKRTYRFAGSAIEYGPDGPASKRAVERTAKDRKRTKEEPAGAPDSPAEGVSWKAPIVALVLAGLASMVWYYFKRRKTA